MEYKYTLTTINGEMESKLFETRKEAMAYLNAQVKEAKTNNKEWKTYFSNNSKVFYEKELRLATDMKAEEEGIIDLGEEGFEYMSFEITYIGE